MRLVAAYSEPKSAFGMERDGGVSRIYYCCANSQNVGDVVSMCGVKRLVSAPGREIFLEERGVWGRYTLKSRLKRIRRDDTLIIGGGGLLCGYFEPYWRTILEMQDKQQFSIICFGVGTCEPYAADARMSEGLLRELFERMRGAYVRPPVETVGREGVTGVTFCPSISYLTSRASEYVKCHTLPRRLLYVRHPSLTGAERSEHIGDMLNELCRQKGWRYDEVKNKTAKRRTIGHILRQYGLATHVVTCRLHGYIIGRVFQKNTVAVSADRKIDAFAAQVDDPQPLPLSDCTREELSDRISCASAWDGSKLGSVNEDLEGIAAQVRALARSNGRVGSEELSLGKGP